MLRTVLYSQSSTTIILDQLQVGETGAIVSDASVSATLTDGTGTPVPGGPGWPILCPLVDATTGRYEGQLPTTLTLTPGAAYTLTVVATRPDGLTRRFALPIVAAVP